jgi:hypothetical protein
VSKLEDDFFKVEEEFEKVAEELVGKLFLFVFHARV